jgi:hypothetical protein
MPLDLENTSNYIISGSIMRADLFHRVHPASIDISNEYREFVQEVIDHGCLILHEVNGIRPGNEMRDSVTAALLRRTLITGEGVRVLLMQGLEEDALVLFRTLLDIEVNFRLVTSDKTDEMARRLAAFQYLKGQHHINKIFSHPCTRKDIDENAQDLKFMHEAGKRMKEHFGMPAFDAVRDLVKTKPYWYGLSNVEEAFTKVDHTSDYIYLYDNLSPYTHASNLDIDFADIRDGVPVLKALPQRDPVRNLNLVYGLSLKLVTIFELFLQDRGNPNYQVDLEVRNLENGECFKCSPITALQIKIHEIFGDAFCDESEQSR